MQLNPSTVPSRAPLQSIAPRTAAVPSPTSSSTSPVPVQTANPKDHTQLASTQGTAPTHVALVTEEQPDLNDVRAGKVVLEAGSSGPAVAELQTKLNNLGYDLSSSGEMGPETVAMLKKFQADYGVQVTGQLGPSTVKVLDWAINQTNAIAALRKVTPKQLKSMGPAQFFKTLMPAALESERKYKVPAAVTLAQAALESGFAASPIGGYNIFGIKGKGPAGSVRVSTQEFYNGRYVTIKDNFAKYHDFYEAVSEHGKNYHNGYYNKGVTQFAKDRNVNRFIENVAPVYATDPNYAGKLKAMIRSHGIDTLVQQARSPR
jgi:flagellum-specific peptidoglycan hydrolase FlgJ